MSETTLKPCPFCGGPAQEFHWPQRFGCTDKDCAGYAANLPRAKWNRRAAHADRDGVIESLKAALMWLLEHPACQASYSKDHEMARRVDHGVTALLKAGVDLPDEWPDPRSLKSTTEDSHDP